VRLRGSAEAGQQELKEGEGESGAGLAGGRGAEPSAREMRHMTARGVAVQNLEQEALDGGRGRQHAVAPGGLAGLLARRHHRVRLEWGRPLCFQARQHGSDTGYHPSTSGMYVGGPAPSYRRSEGKPMFSEILRNSELTPKLHAIRVLAGFGETGEVWRSSTVTVK
jgi:hypothetical protein